VTANFAPITTQYQLTTGVSLASGGTVSPSCPGGCSYNSGSQVTITATPAAGYTFTGFTGSINSGSNPLTVTINSAMTVMANLTQTATSYPLTTTVSPSAGGTVSPSCPGGCSYGSGSQVAITATPAAGYQFTGFTGSINSASNPFTVTMNGAMTVTANFVTQSSPPPATQALSINGGSNSAEVAPSTNVSMAFNLFDQSGANDISWGQFYLADSSGNAYCMGDWGRPNALNLYDSGTGTTSGFGINQSDSFCTVSLTSITNSPTDPTQVTVVLNFNFSPGPGGTYTVLTQINYGSGYAGPWEALGTLIIDPGRVTISGRVNASGYPLIGATVTLSGSQTATMTTDSTGAYSFIETVGGNYTVTPTEAGLVFTPAFLTWNNLTTSQTGDFTALPTDYQDGSGPTTIPNSFTAPDPVLVCDDISGVWEDDDEFGNGISWNLTQTVPP